MTKLLLLLVLSLTCAKGQATFRALNGLTVASGGTVVQGCNNSSTSTSGMSITCTFGSAIGAGHVLYMCVTNVTSITSLSWSGDSGTFTADPGAGTPITNIEWETSDPDFVSCVYVPSTGGGGAVITATFSENFPSIIGIEMSGVTNLTQSDNGSAQNSNGPSPITSLAITPGSSNSLLIGVAFTNFTTTQTAGTNVPWVLVSGTATVIESYLQPTAASVTAQMNFTGGSGGARNWWGHIVAFH